MWTPLINENAELTQNTFDRIRIRPALYINSAAGPNPDEKHWPVSTVAQQATHAQEDHQYGGVNHHT